jgi:hypothetical protein
MPQEIHTATVDQPCPFCQGRIVFGLAGQAPPFNRAAICPHCRQIFVTTSALQFRRSTPAEQARIETTGLGADLREDIDRLHQWRATGRLPPKHCRRPVPEPMFPDVPDLEDRGSRIENRG